MFYYDKLCLTWADKEFLEEKEKAIFYEQIMLRLNKRTKKSLELYAGTSLISPD
jgi:hypothetical protein